MDSAWPRELQVLSLRGIRPTLLERTGGIVGVPLAADRADRGILADVERLGVQDWVALAPLLGGIRRAGMPVFLGGFGAVEDATTMFRSSLAAVPVFAGGTFCSLPGALILTSICRGDGEPKSV